ncbi:MAG: hypothetical protein KIS91_05865 [Anaerolineae bacterium]|nr:hypothetical protein [Anaerolineae bacterium]
MSAPGFSAEASLSKTDGRAYRTRPASRGGGQAVTPQSSHCDQYMAQAMHYADLAIAAMEHHHTAAALRYLDMMETYGTAWEGCEAVHGPSL